MLSTGLHMTELATALTRLGWKITVYCAQPSFTREASAERVAAEMTYEGVRIRRVRALGAHRGRMLSRALFGVTFMLSCCWAVLRDRHYDLVLFTTNPPFLGLAGRLARLLRRKPYVLIVYDVYPDIVRAVGMIGPRSATGWVWERVTRLIMRGAARNVVIGRDMAEIVAKKLSAKDRARMVLIPNWSDERRVAPVDRSANAFRLEHGVGDSAVVQYSGNMGRTHNLECLIEAAEMLRDRDVVFQFIGDGAKKARLAALANEKGLTNVQFLPYQQLERLRETLSAADVAVVCLEQRFTGLSVPSKTYGIMASGTPILAFLEPASEIGRTIAECDCGVLLPDPTAEQVVSSLAELIDHPERRSEMAENGRRAFERDYTLTIAAGRYSAMLEEVLAPAR